MLFSKLAGIVANRTVMLTIADAGDGKFRVCIIPEKKGEDEHSALTTPLITVGTPADLDAGLPDAIASYSESFIPLAEQTRTIQAEREQAAKDEKARLEEERKKRLEKSKKPGATTTAAKPAATATPVTPPKPADATGDLFAGFGASAPSTAPTTATVAAPVATSEDTAEDASDESSNEADAPGDEHEDEGAEACAV